MIPDGWAVLTFSDWRSCDMTWERVEFWLDALGDNEVIA